MLGNTNFESRLSEMLFSPVPPKKNSLVNFVTKKKKNLYLFLILLIFPSPSHNESPKERTEEKVDVSNIFSQMYFFKLIASFTSYPEASSLLVQIVFSRCLVIHKVFILLSPQWPCQVNKTCSVSPLWRLAKVWHTAHKRDMSWESSSESKSSAVDYIRNQITQFPFKTPICRCWDTKKYLYCNFISHFALCSIPLNRMKNIWTL